MSKPKNSNSIEEQKKQFTEEYNRSRDPLAQLESEYGDSDADFFE